MTKVCQCFKGNSEAQQTSSLLHDLDLEELFVKLGNRFKVRGFLFILKPHTSLHLFVLHSLTRRLKGCSFPFVKNSKRVVNNFTVELPN